MAGATEEWRNWPPSMDGITYSQVPDDPDHDRIQLSDLIQHLSNFSITSACPDPMEIDLPTALSRAERNPTDADENRKTQKAAFERPEACMICAEEDPEAIATVDCGHNWCCTCIYELISRAASDESAYPPKCCGTIIDIHGITYEDEEGCLDEDGYANFEGYAPWTRYMFREEEYTTPHRTYCFSPSCAHFIPTRRIVDQFASCLRCGEYTCSKCKNKAHGGECPIDTAIQQTLEVAKANGWKSCPICDRLIEKKSGCNHIAYVSPPPPFRGPPRLTQFIKVCMQLRILLRMRESMGVLQVPLIQSWRLGVSLSKGKSHCLGGLGSCSSMPCVQRYR